MKAISDLFNKIELKNEKKVKYNVAAFLGF